MLPFPVSLPVVQRSESYADRIQPEYSNQSANKGDEKLPREVLGGAALCHATMVRCPEVEFIRGLKRKIGHRRRLETGEIVLLDEYAVRFCGRKFSAGL